LEAALKQARAAERTSVIVIDTDPTRRHGKPADIGGMSAVPGGLGARGSPRRTRRLRNRAEGAAAGRLTMAVRIGANPIGWSNDDMRELGGATPLEVCLAEAREAGLRGHGARPQVSARAAGAREVLGKFGLALVSGWYSAELLRRDCRRGDAATCGRISTCSRRSAATCWCSPRPRTRSTAIASMPAGRSGPLLAGLRLGAVRRSA
jgi:hypothetical protein